MCYVIIFLQMAKHVGLIPSLDGGLYQVSGDKVEVNMIKSNSNQVLSSSTFEVVIWQPESLNGHLKEKFHCRKKRREKSAVYNYILMSTQP